MSQRAACSAAQDVPAAMSDSTSRMQNHNRLRPSISATRSAPAARSLSAAPSVVVRRFTGMREGHVAISLGTQRSMVKWEPAAARTADFEASTGYALVKVQRPDLAHVVPPGERRGGLATALLVYTQSRQLSTFVEDTDPAWEALAGAVRDKGLMSIKCYFLCKLELEGDGAMASGGREEEVLRIFLEPQPPQDW